MGYRHVLVSDAPRRARKSGAFDVHFWNSLVTFLRGNVNLAKEDPHFRTEVWESVWKSARACLDYEHVTRPAEVSGYLWRMLANLATEAGYDPDLSWEE